MAAADVIIRIEALWSLVAEEMRELTPRTGELSIATGAGGDSTRK